MRKRYAVLALAAALVCTVVQPARGTAYRSAGDNYGQYSLMFERSAGQYFANGQVAGQWAWQPLDATTSDVAWGDPKVWPPGYAERFVREGGWVLLEGYTSGGGEPVTQVQRVTSEKIGDANCRNMQPVPSSGGRLHYVKWDIPATGYCLDATGTIKNPQAGTVVNFRHVQKWGPPRPCSNYYLSGQTCIAQFEQWWDDNQHLYRLEIQRTQYLARGLGHAFKIRTTVPVTWNADGRYYWHW